MGQTELSVIIPTYNEHITNILRLVDVIKEKLPAGLSTEIVIVDDNSPDGTGRLVSDYIQNPLTSLRIAQQPNYFSPKNAMFIIKLVHRERAAYLCYFRGNKVFYSFAW